MDDLLNQYGFLIVFVNVLLDQVGFPFPALPILIAAGALTTNGVLSPTAIFLTALVASAIGDTIWYLAGRRYGQHVVKFMCRISLSPDYCVRETEIRYERWGQLTLIFGKFIPGISAIAPPLAGALKMDWITFLILDAIGTAVWIAAGLLAGIFFHVQILYLLEYLDTLGTAGVEMLAVIFAGYLAIKWVQRRRFYQQLQMARISVDELLTLVTGGKPATIVDVRSSTAQQIDPRFIPGALVMDIHAIEKRLHELPTDHDIVFYCSCPNDASSAFVARKLIERGFTNVRPLHGGLDAWVEAGHAVEIRASQSG